MGAYPGRVMTGIRDALAEHGKLSYRQLCYMLYGPESTDADRASMARAIRQLMAKGAVISYFEAGSRVVDGQHVESGMWVRRPDVPHVPADRFFPLPTDGDGSRPRIGDMSRAELLEFDPRYGDREDCLSCGMRYQDCFLLGDNMHKPGPWDGSPYRCCFECFHRGRAF
jgi:hypothetical protein